MSGKQNVKVVESLIEDFHHMKNNLIEVDTYGFSKGREWGVSSSKEDYKKYMDKEFKTIGSKIDSLSQSDTKTAFKNKFNILFNRYSILFCLVVFLLICLF